MKKDQTKLHTLEVSVAGEPIHSNIDLDRFRNIAKPESAEELVIENDFSENGELYKASMRIAMKVRRALRVAGMTQVALADKLGMDSDAVGKSLNGKANLELETLVKLEKALGITIIATDDN